MVRAGGTARTASGVWSALSALMLLGLVLSGCGADPYQGQARQNRARLDTELQRAHQVGVPVNLLAPIESQESKVVAGQGGWGYSYQNAASNYTLLYNQVLSAEQASIDTLKEQALKNVTQFSTILNERKSQGFVGANDYQVRLSQAFQQLSAAKTPSDYAQVGSFALDQANALEALWPAYQKLQDFKSALDALQKAGIDTEWTQAAYSEDLAVFASAASVDRYAHLGQVIDGQINQLVADRIEVLPYVGESMLAQYQAQINILAGWGEDTSAFQHAYDAVRQQFTQAKTLADYLTLSQALNQQTQQMALPFARGRAKNALRQLQFAVSKDEAINPLIAYEYADPVRGVGDVEQQVSDAAYAWHPVDAYDQAYENTHDMLLNLRSMNDNLKDPTPGWQPHQSDLDLLAAYHVLSGQVTVVSLREQTARMYDNGKMVYWSYVTTGRYERPSPPGLHYAYWKQTHILFEPTEPVGSPIRGFPTPINYGVYYADYGFFLHDAWWRVGFGPGSNLPHWDPAAFNGGSHGCINFPLQNMAWYYNWVQPGSPVLVY
ncbi:MAG TPA: L,D-transpeptidase [Ktedonobacterales bacterium]